MKVVTYLPNKESGLEMIKQINDTQKVNVTMKSKTNPAIILLHPEERTMSKTSTMNSNYAKIATSIVKIGLLVNWQSTAHATATGATFSINNSVVLAYGLYVGVHGVGVIFSLTLSDDVKGTRASCCRRCFDLVRVMSIVGGCVRAEARFKAVTI